MAAGMTSSRTRVTSMRMAEAMPTPMILTVTAGSRANPAATAIMMAAADTTIRADAAIPVTICRRGSAVVRRCSAIRVTRKIS